MENKSNNFECRSQTGPFGPNASIQTHGLNQQMQRNGNYSSGFYSGMSSNMGEQLLRTSVSLPPTARSIDSNTASRLNNLWGDPPPTVPRFDRPSTQLSQSIDPQRLRPPSNASQISLPSESDLLRDFLFVLGGTNVSMITYDPNQDGFVLVKDAPVPVRIRSTVLRLAQCGWLYNQVKEFVSFTLNNPDSGLLIRSLASGLQEQLNEYLSLLSSLEVEINRENKDMLASLASQSTTTCFARPNQFNVAGSLANFPPGSLRDSVDPSRGPSRLGNSTNEPPPPAYLTLTQLHVWLDEPRARLDFLFQLTQGCQGRKGGGIASVLFTFSRRGEPDLAGLANRLLVGIGSTLLRLIQAWLYDGSLDDPCHEFFVASSPSSIKIGRLWYDKYKLRRLMIPKFITPQQANKILLTGKSVNFLIHACGEKQVVKNYEVVQRSKLKRIESMFEQDADPAFDNMISTAYKETSSHLLKILNEKFHFLDHLNATRQILLLGQGDFIQHLMDLSASELHKPADDLLTHRLNSMLDLAIRDTLTSQYESMDILHRLEVRLLDKSSGDTGWDIFALEYHVDGPLATVFTDDSRLMYLRAFNLLWRVKRIEFSLSALLKDQWFAARLDHDLGRELEPMLHPAQLLVGELRHFIQQLQYYVNFEVLECAWEALVKQIRSATDLDQIIDAHKLFLTTVLTRCLLDISSRKLIGQLRALFDLILDFIQQHQAFNALAQDEFRVRDQYVTNIQTIKSRSKWSTDIASEKREADRRRAFLDEHAAPFHNRIRILAKSFRDLLINFMRSLCDHPDPRLRILVDNLNFNDNYRLDDDEPQGPAQGRRLFSSETTIPPSLNSSFTSIGGGASPTKTNWQ